MTNTSSVALHGNDTKCYRAIRSAEDMNCLQSDLDRVEQWCREWRTELNQLKCGLWSPQGDQECEFYRVSLPSNKQHQWAKRSRNSGHL